MRLLSFVRPDGSPTWGVHRSGWVVDVPAVLADRAAPGEPAAPARIIDLLAAGHRGTELVRAAVDTASWEPGPGRPPHSYRDDDISWLPPVPGARMLSMRGNNPILLRLDGLSKPTFPTLTPRHPAGLIGHGQDLVLRPQDGRIGWGAEVVAVIGAVTKGVDSVQARSAIAGYTATNDLSGDCFGEVVAPGLARADYTYRDEHFAGKFYGTWSMPQAVGPWIVTADEVRDPYALTVRAWENSVLCDTVTTAAMLFSFEDMIAFLSSFMTLRPGDMISSGALGYHVIDGLDHYPNGSDFLIEVDGIGGLRSPILDQRRGLP